MEIQDFILDELDYAPIAKYKWYHSHLNALKQALLKEWYFGRGGKRSAEVNVLEKVAENIIQEVVEKHKHDVRTKVGEKTENARRYLQDKKKRELFVNRLMYSWRSEGAIDVPPYEKPMHIFDEKIMDLSDERMLFADWKIIKMYYSVYASTQAIIIVTLGEPIFSHYGTIREFNSRILFPFRDILYVFPFSCIRKNGEFITPPVLQKYPELSADLERWLRTTEEEEKKRHYLQYEKERKRNPSKPRMYLRSKKHPERIISVGMTSYLNCLLRLRKWANYKEVKPFVKWLEVSSMRKELDTNITWITFVFNLLNEIYLIHLLRSPIVCDSMNRLSRLMKGKGCSYMNVRKKLYESLVHPSLRI